MKLNALMVLPAISACVLRDSMGQIESMILMTASMQTAKTMLPVLTRSMTLVAFVRKDLLGHYVR